jgi:hypothetical protein
MIDATAVFSKQPYNVPAERVVDFDIFNSFTEEERDSYRAWTGLRESSAFEIVWTPHNEGHWVGLGLLVTNVLTDSTR